MVAAKNCMVFGQIHAYAVKYIYWCWTYNYYCNISWTVWGRAQNVHRMNTDGIEQEHETMSDRRQWWVSARRAVINISTTHQRPPTNTPHSHPSRLSTTRAALSHQTDAVRTTTTAQTYVCLIGVHDVQETRRPSNEYSSIPSHPQLRCPFQLLSSSRSARTSFAVLLSPAVLSRCRLG